MAGVQMGFQGGLGKTPFIAQVDPERCDYCGECLRTCNVKCIGLAAGARSGSWTGFVPSPRGRRVDAATARCARMWWRMFWK